MSSERANFAVLVGRFQMNRPAAWNLTPDEDRLLILQDFEQFAMPLTATANDQPQKEH